MNIPKNKPIRLKGRAYTEFRRSIYEREDGICQDCRRYAPLNGPDVFSMGHLSHIKSHGAGGSDVPENVKWNCYQCHIISKHGLKWSNGKRS